MSILHRNSNGKIMTMTATGRSSSCGPSTTTSRMLITARFVLLLLVLSANATAQGTEDHASTSNTPTSSSSATSTTASTSSSLLRRRRPRTSSSRPFQQQRLQQLQKQQHRPNVLMVIADQMRYDMIRYVQDTLPQYNNGQLKISTPNLDKLLQSGAYFETTYTQCAVCAPARATLRTGTTIERHGVQHNDLTRDENLYHYQTTTTDEDIDSDGDGDVDIEDQEEQIFDDPEGGGGVGGDGNQTQPQSSSSSSPSSSQQQQPASSSSSKLAYQFSDRVNSVKTIDHLLVQTEGYVSEYYGKLHLPRAMSYEKLPQHLLLDPINNSSNNSNNPATPAATTTTLSRRSYNLDRPIFQHNDYDYASQQFTFQFDSDGRKNTRYLNHHEQVLNEVSSTNFPIDGMQLDTFTKFPYLPSQLDTRYGQPTNTDLQAMNISDSASLTQDNVIGRFVQGNGSLSTNYTPTFFTADVVTKALERLQREETQQPWFVTASFHSPHPPYVASWEYAEKYWNERDRILIPQSLAGSLDPELPAAYRRMTSTDAYQDPAKVQEWTAVYMALIEEVDTKIGELLDAVNDLDNTVVIFTSDHGEMLGSHGRRSKNNFYEEASRVPLLISWPANIEANQTIKDPVSHIDIVSTILDFVGAKPGTDVSDGKSLRRYMKMKTPPTTSAPITNPLTKVASDFLFSSNEERSIPNTLFDETFVVSEWDFRKPLLSNPHGELERPIDDRPNFMVRKGEYKLLMSKLASSNKPDFLFDLSQDPFEMNNLLSKSSPPTKESVASAEHLRCLLLSWMTRMDQHPTTGSTRYYSDPSANYYQNRGDISEIFSRQISNSTGFWTSHSQVKPFKFGQVSRLDHEDGSSWVRHEWLFVGTRLDETIIIDQVEIAGTDAMYFTTQRPDLKVFGGTPPPEEPNRQQGCEGIRITFMADVWAIRGQVDASIILTVRDKSQVIIPIILTDPTMIQ